MFVTVFATAVSHLSVNATGQLLNSMGVLQNCRMIRNMENVKGKTANNDDGSSIVLTSIVITEHDVDGADGQIDRNNSVTTREVGVAEGRSEWACRRV